MKAILVGAGFVGKLHLAAARDLESLCYVAVVDPDPKTAGAVARQFGLPGYARLEDALDRHPADAADLCAPTNAHPALIRASLAAQLDILCEKPLALTVEDALALEREIRSSGSRLMVAEIIRFWPHYAAALEIVRSGRFGSLREAHLQRLSAPPSNSWMLDPELGGGAAVDLQIHDFSFLLQLLGRARSIEPVPAIAGKGPNSVFNLIAFDGGPTVTNRATFEMPPSFVFRSSFELILEGGSIDFDDWRAPAEQLLVFPATGPREAVDPGAVNPFALELDYFARRVRDREAFDRAPLDESIFALRMCQASRRAHETGRRVALGDD